MTTRQKMERRMNPKDRAVIDQLLKRNVIAVCPRNKKVCKLVTLLFKALNLVWKECRLLEEEIKFITEDEVGIEYFNKQVKPRGRR